MTNQKILIIDDDPDIVEAMRMPLEANFYNVVTANNGKELTQGFMLGQYLAKLYVDKLTGKKVPDYFKRLSISGDGLLEKAFK